MIDIPKAADDIPIVSHLAKKELKQDQKEEKIAKTKDKLSQFIQKDQDELETHFVENPFIKIREKASKKQLEASKQLQEQDIDDMEKDN